MQAIHATGASGSSAVRPTFDGWLTAFMYWDQYGVCMASKAKVNCAGEKLLELDGVTFPIIYQSVNGIPSTIMEIPVTVRELRLGLKFTTRIIVGSMGMIVKVSPKDDVHSDDGNVNMVWHALEDGIGKVSTVQICSGYWMIEDGRELLGEGE
jgi:hypothetical protein